jgi:hypothetical protein
MGRMGGEQCLLAERDLEIDVMKEVLKKSGRSTGSAIGGETDDRAWAERAAGVGDAAASRRGGKPQARVSFVETAGAGIGEEKAEEETLGSKRSIAKGRESEPDLDL